MLLLDPLLMDCFSSLEVLSLALSAPLEYCIDNIMSTSITYVRSAIDIK